MSPTKRTTQTIETTPPQPEPEGSSSDGLRRGVFIPRWVLGLLALVAVAALGFGVGRWTDDSHEHGGDQREIVNGRGVLPGNRLPGNRRPVFPGNGGNTGGTQGPSTQGPSTQLPPATQGTVFLGVSVQDGTSPQGAQVVSVVTGSPADAAGLKAGDVITAVDGNAVTSASQLATRIQAHNSGDQVSLTYTRAGSSGTAQVKLGSRSTSSAPVA